MCRRCCSLTLLIDELSALVTKNSQYLSSMEALYSFTDTDPINQLEYCFRDSEARFALYKQEVGNYHVAVFVLDSNTSHNKIAFPSTLTSSQYPISRCKVCRRGAALGQCFTTVLCFFTLMLVVGSVLRLYQDVEHNKFHPLCRHYGIHLVRFQLNKLVQHTKGNEGVFIEG